MDRLISLEEISRRLYSRSMHRLFGNPAAGTLTSFLTVVFIIRQTVNLYFVYFFSSGESMIDYQQIACGWFIYMSAYLVLCSSLSAYHVSFALPPESFISLTEAGGRYRKSFLRYAAVVRPMNAVMLIISIAALFIFATTGGANIMLPVLPLVTAIPLSYLVFRLSEKLETGMIEAQLLETLFIVILIMLNPDVILWNGRIVMLLNGADLQFDSTLLLIAGPLIPALILGILLFLFRLIARLNSFIHSRKLKTGPMLSWYIHFYKPGFWLFLYLLVIPALFFDLLPEQVSSNTVPVFSVFSVLMYVVFILNCENRIRSVFRKTLLSRENLVLTAAPLPVHIFLSAVPLIIQLSAQRL